VRHLCEELSDAQARGIDLSRNIGMIAGAGSGKTRVLTARFLEILERLRKKPDIDPGYALSSVAAITYTRKASAEMRERIAECCAELAAKEGGGGFWAETALKMAEARISTIHKFCGGIIGEYPIEAGISLDNLEGVRSSGDVLRVAKRYCRTLSDENHPLHQTTKEFARLTHWSDLPELLEKAFSQKTSLLIYNSNMPDTAEALAENWRTKTEEIFRSIDPGYFEHIEKSLAEVQEFDGLGSPEDELAVVIEQLAQFDLDSKKPKSLFTLVDLLSDEEGNFLAVGKLGSAKNWPKSTISKAKRPLMTLREQLKTISPFFPRDISERDLADAQATILFKRIFDGFIDEERDNLPPETEPDFEDLLIAANRIVRTEGMAKEIAGGLSGLLVDEFQDTDPLQWNTIRQLAENIAGKFFWVGDPKQSIYKFRGADVSNVYKSEKWVIEKGGDVFTLNGNYRTAPAVLAFANHTAEIFLSEKPVVDLNFHAKPQRLTCERRLSEGFTGSVEILISPEGPVEESEMLARRIYCAVNGDEEGFGILEVADGNSVRPARWGDIAVLYPQRKPIEIGLRESLLARDIPFFTIGSQSFYASEETIAVRDLILYLDDPRDKVSLMAVLRGPLFTMPDTALYSAVIAGSGDLRKGLDVIFEDTNTPAKELLFPNDHELTRECASEIAFYETLALSVPPSQLASTVLSRRGMWAYFRGMSNGIQRAANLEKILRILSDYDHKGISAAADHFRIIKESKEGEREEAVETEGRDAIRLMTVHQSKGLEFPIVFAANLSVNMDGLKGHNIFIDGHLGAIIKSRIANSSAKSDYYLTFQHLMRERSSAETKRVMYVAMTRAKDNLILSGTKFGGRYMGLIADSLQLEIPDSGRESNRIETPDGSVKILVSSGKDSWQAQIPEKKPGVPIYIRAGKGEFFNPKIRLVPEVDSGEGEYNLRATDLPRLLNSPKDNLVKSLRDSFPRHESPASPTGMDWGNMIHAFFENLPTPLPNADEIRNIATNVVEKSPFGPSQITVLTSLTETEAVAEVFSEDVMEYHNEERILLLEKGMMISGIIDRYWRDARGWHLIDFKSDAVIGEDRARKAEFYTPQLEVYRRALARALNIDHSEISAEILFTYPPVEAVNIPVLDFDSILEKLRAVLS